MAEEQAKGKEIVPAGDSALAPKNNGPIVETSSSAVAARAKAEIEARFLYAMSNPRNFDTARQNILKACERPVFAASAEYAKPVGGRDIIGLSVRFAEEAFRCWGNLDVSVTVVFDDDERRIYRVTAIDLETNATQHQDVIVEKTVERKSTRQGDKIIATRQNTRGEKVYIKEATEDEMMVKSHAMLAKIRRNLILMLIPSDIREEAEALARKTVKDRDAKDPEAARKQILDKFFDLGVTAEQVEAVIGKSLKQLNPAELNLLRKMHQAIKDGEATWADIEADSGLSKLSEKTPEPKDTGKGTAGLKAASKDKAEQIEAAIRREDAEMEKSER